MAHNGHDSDKIDEFDQPGSTPINQDNSNDQVNSDTTYPFTVDGKIPSNSEEIDILQKQIEKKSRKIFCISMAFACFLFLVCTLIFGQSLHGDVLVFNKGHFSHNEIIAICIISSMFTALFTDFAEYYLLDKLLDNISEKFKKERDNIFEKEKVEQKKENGKETDVENVISKNDEI
ncbi:MAG: hypothetical protein MHPSP_003803 [Paramarteilia canceri]